MEVLRSTIVNTKKFELGDIISFTLTTGEEVKAKAVSKTLDGMLFITVDCLKDEYPMFKKPKKMGSMQINYFNSDLRHTLNRKIFDTFPEKIKSRMIGMRVDNTDEFDMLRIPTEREIFGENLYGEGESVDVRHFCGMENRCERIVWGWYWLQNRDENDDYYFVIVSHSGCSFHLNASDSNGVRLVFQLENEMDDYLKDI